MIDAEGFANVAEIAALPGVDAVRRIGSIAGLDSQEFMDDALDRVLEARVAVSQDSRRAFDETDNAAQMLSRGQAVYRLIQISFRAQLKVQAIILIFVRHLPSLHPKKCISAMTGQLDTTHDFLSWFD